MIECVIPYSASEECLKEIERSLEAFSAAVSCYGFTATLSYSDTAKANNPCITLLVDNEMIQAMKGAKRGPKEKATNISIEEMLELKKQGLAPKEIAALAGVGVATYFRRMAAYKAQLSSENKSGKEEA